MPQHVIQQPDGRWCVFSTIVDAITVFDATEDEIIDYFADRAAEDARRSTRDYLDRIKAGKADPRRPTYEQALRDHEERHGPLEAVDQGGTPDA
jgi:hypothetical protein